MDIRLREIASKAAGTYFLLTDNSVAPEYVSNGKTRLIFINTPQGPVNTVVLFKKGEKTAFQNIFGKRQRKQEKLGNFSIYTVLDALDSSDVAVMNLRKFDTVDKAGVVGLNPNTQAPEEKLSQYSKLFNENGFWTVKPNNITKVLTQPHLLNFSNVGRNNISFFVVKSQRVDSLTKHGEDTLANIPLEVEDYPALVAEQKFKDTFVDVYIFNNTFENASLNKSYGHLFNASGLLNAGRIAELITIKEAGFNKVISGTLIPNMKNEQNEEISIDTLINKSFAETGLTCYINDDVLEDEKLGGLPVINTELEGYYTIDGKIGSVGNFLSYRCQTETPFEVDLSAVKSAMITDLSDTFMVETKGGIFPTGKEYKNEVYSLFENNIRVGAKILFKDKDTDKIVHTEVSKIEIVEENLPNTDGNKERLNKATLTAKEITNSTIKFAVGDVANATLYTVYRRTSGTGLATDNNFVVVGSLQAAGDFTDTSLENQKDYVYMVKASAPNMIASYSKGLKAKCGGQVSDVTEDNNKIPADLPDEPKSLKTWKKLKLTTVVPVNADSYVRQLDIVKYKNAKILPTSLVAYTPRDEQFLNGSPTKQKEILDVMLEPGLVKGLKNFEGLRYLVDAFKSFVEAGYKYQFGQLTEELKKSNKFVRAIINEPFVEDFDKSANPLFKDEPGVTLNLEKYLETGGNTTYSTVFLSKPATGGENCFYFGSEVDRAGNEFPLAGKISNLFVQKSQEWDIIANTTGYIDGVKGIPFNPDSNERRAMENFSWNPIIKTNKGYTIYGNLTGQKKRTSLSQIHNSELFAYIVRKLEEMSRDEAFKAGTYNEFLQTEVEYQSFMDELANIGAIQPNPIVICNQENNTTENQKAKIKVVHIEYRNINAIEKVVFDLKLN